MLHNLFGGGLGSGQCAPMDDIDPLPVVIFAQFTGEITIGLGQPFLRFGRGGQHLRIGYPGFDMKENNFEHWLLRHNRLLSW